MSYKSGVLCEISAQNIPDHLSIEVLFMLKQQYTLKKVENVKKKTITGPL